MNNPLRNKILTPSPGDWWFWRECKLPVCLGVWSGVGSWQPFWSRSWKSYMWKKRRGVASSPITPPFGSVSALLLCLFKGKCVKSAHLCVCMFLQFLTSLAFHFAEKRRKKNSWKTFFMRLIGSYFKYVLVYATTLILSSIMTSHIWLASIDHLKLNTSVHLHMCTHTYTNTDTFANKHIVCMDACLQTHAQAYIDTHTSAKTCMDTHICTHGRLTFTSFSCLEKCGTV